MAFTNRLINESSPYLLQHAHNPVEWYPWGEEALALAKQSNKPILVSIGYSACHWCHVMEKESFENETTAAYMNEHFINIKIDREERPDLDHIYMDAVQAIAGNGGWPLNVFLTTDLKPFYGGTYFPPQRAFNRPSWLEVLGLMKDAWVNKREEIEQQAQVLIDHIGKSGNFLQDKLQLHHEEFFTEEDAKKTTSNLLKNADKHEGGFGNAPKFPQTFSINYLMYYGHFFGDKVAMEQAFLSLRKMLRGGIYDHLAGGLCRYSTDAAWLVPHFEKMLYDNALLMISLSEAFQLSGDKEFENGMLSIYHFLKNEMQDASGGFYAALDADSEGEEGKYYVWQKKEIDEILKEEAVLCCKWFGITEDGNWEEKNILTKKKTVAEFSLEEGIEHNLLEEKISTWIEKLSAERSKRVRPGTDDKILLGWNALLVTALCKAYAATEAQMYKVDAENLYERLIILFEINPGILLHTYKNGKATVPAFLDDYANLIEAAIHLQEISGNQQYLHDAKRFSETVIHSYSADSGLFYFTGKGQKDVVLRKIELYDGAVPSGNSVMLDNLMYLSVVFDIPAWKERVIVVLESLKKAYVKYPSSFAVHAKVCLKQLLGLNEIVITGKNYEEMLKDILRIYLPNRIIQSSMVKSDMPLLKDKDYEKERLIYLCRDYMCKGPVSSLSEFRSILIVKP